MGRIMLRPMASSAVAGKRLLDDLTWRGLIQDLSDRDGLANALEAGQLTVYAGYDPTASSLHVGNLQIVLLQRRFQLAGHRIVVLTGGGTGLIGDPSGKIGERALRDEKTVASLSSAIQQQLRHLLPPDRDGTGRVVFEDNVEWISQLSTVELLRDIGKHFPLGSMLSKDSVASRLGDESRGISYTEFSYMVLQALDFQVLYDRHDCRLQVGGSDQWGNITAGLELLRRTRRPGAFGFTAPLILRADGTKFGKSEEGAVWLDRSRTSPFAFYQYFLNVPDSDAGTLLRRLSLCSREEIEALEGALAQQPDSRVAQRALAEELTSFVHGSDGLTEALEATEWLFGNGSLRADRDAAQMFAGAPGVIIDARRWPGWDRVLVEAGLASSSSNARRLLVGGGVYINDRRVDPREDELTPSDFGDGGLAVLRKGKRHRVVLRLSGE